MISSPNNFELWDVPVNIQVIHMISVNMFSQESYKSYAYSPL